MPQVTSGCSASLFGSIRMHIIFHLIGHIFLTFFYYFQTFVLRPNTCFLWDSSRPLSAYCHRELHFPGPLARESWPMGGRCTKTGGWDGGGNMVYLLFLPLVSSLQQWWCLFHAFRSPCTPLSLFQLLLGNLCGSSSHRTALFLGSGKQSL